PCRAPRRAAWTSSATSASACWPSRSPPGPVRWPSWSARCAPPGADPGAAPAGAAGSALLEGVQGDGHRDHQAAVDRGLLDVDGVPVPQAPPLVDAEQRPAVRARDVEVV